ncbi:PHD-finger domain-containing protein, putative [Babesia ovis]|uniref:PHD-finger domain-containing protein, putative n=1 Tax=Babesia ovis TaxID=5869 RepID=A0A9W5TAR1_BABOV|nr:PHD-finger domain-containing protein, putative [Babesia ovis]
MRRYGSHRNTKRFEWHPYSVLFTKVTPEWFSAEINPYMETTELCKDLRSVLVFDKCAETASDLSRLTLECEPCLMNISNSMALQLKQQSITMRLSGKVDAEASEIGPTRDTSNRDNGAHNSHRLSNPLTPIIEHMNMLPPRYDINIRNALMDKFQMVGYRTHRPIFVLARFGNKAAWFSIAYLRSKKYGYTKRIVLDYINLGILEYEYLQRVIRSCYYLPMQTKVIPIIAKPAERNEQEVNGDVDKVTLGGFCWDVEPTVEGYLTNRLVTPLKLSDDTSQANTHPFGGSLINVEDVEANMLYKEDATTRTTNFVSKQANILVGILRTVNNAIEEHKKLIMEKVAAEHAYRNRVHENALMTDQYSKLAFQMNRWSHFRQSLMQSLDMFNSILAYETQADSETSQSIKAKAEATNDISEKEFCSVCLLSEPAHKLLMHQCNRCFIRVHYKCYVVYKTLVGDQVNLDVKPEGTTNEWYCDPCEYEILMNANSKSALCNNAVCCVCYSSGGALKRVSEVAGKRQQSMLPIKWIHLHCVALLMPRVICHDWAALNKWELRNVKFTTGEKCMICLVNGGIMLHCAERDCHVKFHTTCAWIGGAYVTESPFHNSTEIEGGRKMFTPNAELFPTLALRVYCIKHTVERFSEK